MRVFADTNVLLSGLISNGLCHTLVHQCLIKSKAQGFISARVLQEFERHMRDKFKKSPAEIQEAMRLLAVNFVTIEPASSPISQCPDPDDAWILADALKAQCHLFVTGDKALLQMEAISRSPDRNHNTRVSDAMRIVAPRTCLEILLAQA